MPYRIALVNSLVAHLLEGAVLGTLAVWQGISAGLAIIDAASWDRITGEHGLEFCLLVALIVVWGKSIRDDASRERRHNEMLAAQDDHFAALLKLNTKTADDLKDLTVEGIRAQMVTAQGLVDLTKALDVRPCAKAQGPL